MPITIKDCLSTIQIGSKLNYDYKAFPRDLDILDEYYLDLQDGLKVTEITSYKIVVKRIDGNHCRNGFDYWTMNLNAILKDHRIESFGEIIKPPFKTRLSLVE